MPRPASNPNEMLKFVVLLAACVGAIQAQDAGATKPTPVPKSCRLDYIKDADDCVKVPRLLTRADFEMCDDDKGKRGERNGERRFKGEREEGDGPTGEAQRMGGKRSRQQREARKGGKASHYGKFGKFGKNKQCNANCKIECAFNNTGLLDASGMINIAAVHTNFEAKAPMAPWTDLVKSAIDACWADVQKAPAPTTPAPTTDMPAVMPKKTCNFQPQLLMQCIDRSLFINAPDSEKIANATLTDCDARVAQLKGCDPMMPGFTGFRDFKMRSEKMKGTGSSEDESGAAAPATVVSKKSKKMRKGKKNLKMRRARRTTTPAPAN